MAFSHVMDDGTLRYQGRLCVPNVDGLRERIMTEAHTSRYSVHPGSTKIYHDLKEVYWWNDMKRNASDFMARCPNCQQKKGRTPTARWVGTEHRNSNMEAGDDQYGLCDRGAQFTTNFWKKFQQGLGTQVNLSIAFHPQTDGQAERTIQMLKDMFNQMPPFEALYGRRCRSPIGWFEIGEAELIGSDLVHQAMEKARTTSKDVFSTPVFHVSILKKVDGDSSLIVPVETIEVNEELTYEEIPVSILDMQVRKLRNKEIASVKVLWRNQQVEEASWEA
ncbi:PREDICTED: uncharacterized protein LOC109222153 [Nicotiana attenuata]|uniref:uncharacterized protein LOC109222153 n=1 Tax=Nicotiana attenuata TaxID=49451 RepID=UPI000905B7BD|nr:PREDICTED: uncharacterized protein LOC109222153 [Nicotiana attenuata]